MTRLFISCGMNGVETAD